MKNLLKPTNNLRYVFTFSLDFSRVLVRVPAGVPAIIDPWLGGRLRKM